MAIIHFSLSTNSGDLAKIEKLISKLEPASQLRLYLQIGYRGIISGKAGAALIDGRQSRAIVPRRNSRTGAGSTLWGSRANIDQDVELKNATTSLAKMIGDSSGKASGPAAPEATKDVITSADASNASASASALIDFAQQKLGQSDEVLKRKSP